MSVPKALRVKLLGPPRIEVDGRPVELDTRKAVAILALLALTKRAHARDELATLLWPEAGEEKARGALRRTLSVLRAGLGGEWVTVEGSRVALLPRGADIDVDRFRSLAAAGRLEDAAVAYDGDFLAGFTLRDAPEFDDWQAEQREALRAELGHVLERLVQEDDAPDRAAVHARRWLSLDPLHEPAHRALMRVHSRRGDRSAALRQYRECVRLLDRELGVAPLPETTALARAIERGTLEAAPSRSPERGPDETAGDLHTLHGEYRKAIVRYEAAAAEAAPPKRSAIEHKLADVHHRRGDWERAELHYRAALGGADDAARSRVHADWSLAAHRRGDGPRAASLAREALRLAERARDPRALAQAHNILGVLTGDRAHLERAVAIADQLGDAATRVAALNNLALACRRSGDSERALALTEVALAASRELGDRHREAALRSNLADLLRDLGRTAEAMRHLKRAVTLFAEIGEPGEMAPEVWKLVEW